MSDLNQPADQPQKNSEDPAAKEVPTMMFVELCYDKLPVLPLEIINTRLADVLPGSRIEGKLTDGGFVVIFHHNHKIKYSDGASVPAQTAILRAQHPDVDSYQRAMNQTWDWDDGTKVIPRITHQLALNEFMARGLAPKTRVMLFNTVLSILLETNPPIAIYAEYAQRMVNPASFTRDSIKIPFFNVRLFRVQDLRPGDTLMDTRGLAALGLPDFQIKFNGLDCAKVGNQLLNYAQYLFDHGDCIKEGHTIQGLAPGQHWTCSLKDALVEPVRDVIDIDPGAPFAIIPPEQ